jgi:hypothetical protein
MSTPIGIKAGVHKVPSSSVYSLYLNDAPKHKMNIYSFLPIRREYIIQIAMKVMFSQSSSAASLQWSRGVTAERKGQWR